MIIIIGGGPAGFFAAITARENDPACPVVLLEKSPSVLGKVKVSGGGRCNVTHACFTPRDLVAHYPRGQKELIGPFHRWGPSETQAWFADHGVDLKTEPDGRMFPVTDTSATIVDCLVGTARSLGVDIRTGCQVTAIVTSPSEGGFTVSLKDGGELTGDRVLLATGGQTSVGGARGGYALAQDMGHTLVDPVPSLFTFRIDDPLLSSLAGVSVAEAEVRLVATGKKDRALCETGPLLVTHRGLSGPVVLKLSAWGARRLHDLSYHFEIAVNWLPDRSEPDLADVLQERARTIGKQQIAAAGLSTLPRRLWAALVERAGIATETRWADLDRRARLRLISALTGTRLIVTGKDTFKEEFVTCGGIPMTEVDMRTMSSRVCPGLYLAGEILDIDGVTGGFNFQSCWTAGYLAGLGLTTTLLETNTERPQMNSATPKLKILFLCTGNSCRSQMAEGWAKTLRGDTFEVWSAGVEIHGMNQRAIAVMDEAGIDISNHHSKLVDDLQHIPFDFVVTVCDNARESCPVFSGPATVVHHSFDDPPHLARNAATEEEALVHYRRVREEIRAFVAEWSP